MLHTLEFVAEAQGEDVDMDMNAVSVPPDSAAGLEHGSTGSHTKKYALIVQGMSPAPGGL